MRRPCRPCRPVWRRPRFGLEKSPCLSLTTNRALTLAIMRRFITKCPLKHKCLSRWRSPYVLESFRPLFLFSFLQPLTSSSVAAPSRRSLASNRAVLMLMRPNSLPCPRLSCHQKMMSQAATTPSVLRLAPLRPNLRIETLLISPISRIGPLSTSSKPTSEHNLLEDGSLAEVRHKSHCLSLSLYSLQCRVAEVSPIYPTLTHYRDNDLPSK